MTRPDRAELLARIPREPDRDPLDVIEWHPASVGRRRHAPRFHVVFAALFGFLLGVVIRGMVG